MPPPPPSPSPPPWRFLAVIAAAASVLVFVRTARHGLGLSADSAAYLAAAASLARGEGFVMYDGTPYAHWPPLLPMLLAPFARLGLDPLAVARIAMSLCHGAIAAACAWLAFRHLTSRALARLAAVLFALSEPLLLTASHLWTDAPFVLCVLACAVHADACQTHAPRRRRDVLVAALLVGAACLLRYVGAALLATVVLLFAARPRDAPLLPRLARAVAFASLAAAPLVPWLARNLAATGALTGPRSASPLVLTDVPALTGKWIALWLVPSATPSALRLLALAALLVLFAMGAYHGARRPALATLALFAAFYLALLGAAAATTAFDGVTERLLAPAYPCVLILALHGAEVVAARLRSPPRALTLAVALWLVYPAARAASNTHDALRQGAGGYATDRWHASPLVAFLAREPPAGTVFSNAPDALYALAGLRARFLPHRDAGPPELPTTAPGPRRIVWSDLKDRPYLWRPEDLRARPRVVQRFADGVVYAVE